MALNDPVSCLLCLDAFERSEMLRVQLRAIAGNGAHQHLICQKCGGAIAAEYLYLNNKVKPEPELAAERNDPPALHLGELVEVDELGRNIPLATESSAAAGVGEVETTNVPSETAVKPQKGNKEGRKGTN